MDSLVTLNGKNLIVLASVSISITLMARMFFFVIGPRQGFKEKRSQKKLWFSSLAIGGLAAGYMLIFMILGYYFPGTSNNIEPNFEFHPW